MKLKGITFIFGSLMFLLSGLANAGLITDNGTSTVDEDSGLVFLDLTHSQFLNYSQHQNPYNWGGFTWRLATVSEFAILLESVTGTTIGDWQGTTITFVDSEADLGNLATLINGSTNWVDFWLDGLDKAPALGALHPSWPDGHVYNVDGSTSAMGLYVRSTVAVPTPSTIAIFALGILGLIARRVKA